VNVRELDDRVLPIAASAVRHFVRAIVGLFRSAGARARAIAQGSRAQRLRSLDNRIGGGRIAERLHAAPNIGAAVVVLLVVAGVALAAYLSYKPGSHTSTPTTQFQTLTIGPRTGQSVRSYADAAAGRLDAAARHKHTSVYALIDLPSYETPAQVEAMFTNLQVVTAYFTARVPGGHTTPYVATILSLKHDLPIMMSRAAKFSRKAAASFAQYLRAVHGNGPDAAKARALFLPFLRGESGAAKQLAHPCACVYALVVQSEAKPLQRLIAAKIARVIDVAPQGAALSAVTFVPLPPSVTRVVPTLESPRPVVTIG